MAWNFDAHPMSTAIKNVKIARKKSTFFPKYFQRNRHFLKKYRFLENIRYIFRFWRFFPPFWLLIYLFRSNNKAMNQLFPTSYWIHKKLWKSWQLYILRPPLQPNHDAPSKKFFWHTILLEKSPTHNNAAPILNAWEQKINFNLPPPDRIGLKCLPMLA